MWILVVVGVLALAAAAAAVLHFRFGLFRPRKGGGRGKSRLLDQPRIEVLESTYVDAERRLVLVRCDRIEHLILVGGPADLVVENDVKKLRGPGTPAPKPADADALLETAGLGTPAQSPERAPAPIERRTTPATPRTEPPAAPRVAPAKPAGLRADAAHERPQRTGDSQPGGSDTRQQQPRTVQPAPLGAARPQPRREQQTAQRGNGRRADQGAGLPAAGVPWAEPDSLENEIVQALRFDPVRRGGDKAPPQHTPKPANAAKPANDPSATLGDLADRLEEALAEEVQSAGHGGQLERDADEFAFDIPSGGEEGADRSDRSAGRTQPEERADQKPASERKSRPARREPQPPPEPAEPAPAAVPEPERRREQPASADRREEAPVISLNSRRREAADPLEDEMARLLGELTGDTKGR